MLDRIEKTGRIGFTLIITAVAICASVLITISIMELFGDGIDKISIVISIMAPGIIAPSVLWYIIGLLIKVQKLERKSHALATYDTLTDLMTRHAFFLNANKAFKLNIRRGTPFSLAYIDLDDFKKINDTNGHAGGDAVLRYFGAKIQQTLRESDIVGRIGGEEFAIGLPDTDFKSSIFVLNKVCSLAREAEIEYNDQTIKFTISVGVAQFDSKNQMNLEQLAKGADDALYQAKKSGKDCIVEYEL